jgi:hypothetical protein
MRHLHTARIKALSIWRGVSLGNRFPCSVFTLLLAWAASPDLGVAADNPTPTPAIKLQALIDGKPAVGLMELAEKVGYTGSLTPGQKSSMDAAFKAAVIPFEPGTSLSFSVNLLQADGSWRNVTSDPRLLVDVGLGALLFDKTGKLMAHPEPGMPAIGSDEIITVHVYFFPDERDRKTFGYNQFYLQAQSRRRASQP